MSAVTYRTVDSPIDPLLLASSPDGLVRIAFACEGFEGVLDSLTGESVTEGTSPILEDAATQLAEYFAGTRRDFDLPLSLPGQSFRRTVQRALRDIPYGETRTYKDVAESVGNPNAVRAVGTACATNPLPLVVPCHRVLRSDGSTGGYLGGADAKKLLLALERPL
ncbi:methylated-DNA--[protein]-cysteine S-methyltransferase [Corynebacterium variabile]|uniref:methylated-DNA--[protein]-cysteine S-methyltransferase n=1 Tax=Corynebacterium variabile TaxID=1727 RepID=UPI003A90B98C